MKPRAPIPPRKAWSQVFSKRNVFEKRLSFVHVEVPKTRKIPYVKTAIENGHLNPFIVDLPMKNGDFPWFFVCLPEGTQNNLPKLGAEKVIIHHQKYVSDEYQITFNEKKDIQLIDDAWYTPH